MVQCYDNCELKTNEKTLCSYKNARENSTIQLFTGKSNKINFKVIYSKITQNYYTRDLRNYVKLQGHANKL